VKHRERLTLNGSPCIHYDKGILYFICIIISTIGLLLRYYTTITKITMIMSMTMVTTISLNNIIKIIGKYNNILTYDIGFVYFISAIITYRTQSAFNVLSYGDRQ